MTPDLTLSMPGSIPRTNLFGFVNIDTSVLHNWTVDSVVKRTIAIGALVLWAAGAVPLITSVHGAPGTQLDYEVQELQGKYSELQNKYGKMQDSIAVVPAQIAVLIERQKVQEERSAERYKEQQDFQWRVVWGLFGFCGTLATLAIGFFLHQMGITFGSSDGRRRRAA